MKHLSFLLAFASLSFSVMGQGDDCIDPALIDPDAVCFLIYDPVCGCNNVTYDNDCFATNNGVTSWVPGECDAAGCIDPSLIDPNAICLDIWDPVCGCDGVTYSNSCYAQSFSGVTEWTMGECETSAVPPCTDLAGLDFGACDMFLGIAFVGGDCVPMSGCDWTIGGVNYTGAFLSSMEECEMTCVEIQTVEPCTDLEGIDFGFCAAVLGVGLVNNVCQTISGCGPIVGNVDYGLALYGSMDECQSCITSVQVAGQDGLAVYPNPANDRITVRHDGPHGGRLTVTDLSGRVVLRKRAEADRTVIDISGLAPGAYLLRIRTGNGERTVRFTKN